MAITLPLEPEMLIPLPLLPLITLDSWKPMLTVAWKRGKGGWLGNHDPYDLVAIDRVAAGDVRGVMGSWDRFEINPCPLVERSV